MGGDDVAGYSSVDVSGFVSAEVIEPAVVLCTVVPEVVATVSPTVMVVLPASVPQTLAVCSPDFNGVRSAKCGKHLLVRIATFLVFLLHSDSCVVAPPYQIAR